MVVLDRDLPSAHGDILCRMITDDDDPAMILVLSDANGPERAAELALGAGDYPARGGIELDHIARTASRDGRQLDLSTKEFGLLHALLRVSPVPLAQKITRIR